MQPEEGLYAKTLVVWYITELLYCLIMSEMNNRLSDAGQKAGQPFVESSGSNNITIKVQSSGGKPSPPNFGLLQTLK